MELSWVSATGGFISGVALTLFASRINYGYNRRFKRRAALEMNAERVFDRMVSLRSMFRSDDEDLRQDMMQGGDGGVLNRVIASWDVELSAMKLGSGPYEEWNATMSVVTQFAERHASHLRGVHEWDMLPQSRQQELEAWHKEHDEQADEPPFDLSKEYGIASEAIERTIATL